MAKLCLTQRRSNLARTSSPDDRYQATLVEANGQGDQIWRIFGHFSIVDFGQYFGKIQKQP
jgi:hypothetical protein